MIKPAFGVASAPSAAGTDEARYYACFWTKDPAHKKNKVFEDGIVSMDGKLAQLFDLDGKVVAKAMMKLTGMDPGQTLDLGRVSLEVTHAVAASEFASGRVFSAGNATSSVALTTVLPRPALKPLGSGITNKLFASSGGGMAPFKPPASLSTGGGGGVASLKPRLGGLVPTKGVAAAAAPSSSSAATGDDADGEGASASNPSSAGSSGLSLGAFKPPTMTSLAVGGGYSLVGFGRGGAGGGYGSISGGPKPRHDPNGPDALVLYWPPGWPGGPSSSSSSSSSSAFSAGAGGGKNPASQIPVVMDPHLGKCLREHQRLGVQFLYDCITGRASDAGTGCILADDMGLGKSLQTVALIWTLLKQSPAGGTTPTIGKAIIVCPSSLVNNWKQEFKKWLGDTRCDPLAVNVQGAEAKIKVNEFVHGKAPVLIISYEMLRKHAEVLTSGDAAGRIGLLVCDEGHRLKSSAGNKTIAALESLPTRRRILLTGTPLQNDLSELYALCNFVCPGALGTLSSFKLTFQGPIEKGRDKSATPYQAGIAVERSSALAERLSRFVLRRTSSVLDKYLPPKTEALVFVKLAPLQIDLYKAIVSSKTARAAAVKGSSSSSSSSSGGGGGGDAGVLVVLNALRQTCAHPDLLHPQAKAATAAAGSSLYGTTASGAPVGGGPNGVARKKKATAPAPMQLGSSFGIGKRKRADGGSDDVSSAAAGGPYGSDSDVSVSLDAIKKRHASSSSASSAPRGGGSASNSNSSSNSKKVKKAIVVVQSDSDSDASGSDSDSEGSLADFIDREGEEEGAEESDDGEEEGGGGGGKRGVVIYDEEEAEEEDDEAGAAVRPYDARLMSLPASVALAEDMQRVFPAGYKPGALATAAPGADINAALEASSKLQLLDALLAQIRRCSSAHFSSTSAEGTSSPDRVVIVSNFAQVLNLVAGLCNARGYSFFRLDGSTPADKRQELVNAFNAPGSSTFAFLLSAQAGGAGLNLVGANRLISLDNSWNPAIDKQALARVWRDGQPKHTFIYRLLCANTLEEKVLQRQALKEAMASALGQGGKASGGGKGGKDGGGEGGARFSQDELRALFQLDPDRCVPGSCDTAAIMNRAYSQATIGVDGSVKGPGGKGAAAVPKSLQWSPYAGPDSIADSVLRQAAQAVGNDNNAASGSGSSSSSSSSSSSAANSGGVVYVKTVLINQPGAAGGEGASAAAAAVDDSGSGDEEVGGGASSSATAASTGGAGVGGTGNAMMDRLEQWEQELELTDSDDE